MEKRKSGFYWVKLHDRWVVAEWFLAAKTWLLTDYRSYFSDAELNVINENRIMSPDEWE